MCLVDQILIFEEQFYCKSDFMVARLECAGAIKCQFMVA